LKSPKVNLLINKNKNKTLKGKSRILRIGANLFKLLQRSS